MNNDGIPRTPYELFGAAYLLSSFSGLAALLRSGVPLNWRLVTSAFLNSGLFGVAIAMIWSELYGEAKYPWFMLGVSVLAGLGGTALVDFAFQAIQEAFRLYATRVGQSVPVPGGYIAPAPPPPQPYQPPAPYQPPTPYQPPAPYHPPQPYQPPPAPAPPAPGPPTPAGPNPPGPAAPSH